MLSLNCPHTAARGRNAPPRTTTPEAPALTLEAEVQSNEAPEEWRTANVVPQALQPVILKHNLGFYNFS